MSTEFGLVVSELSYALSDRQQYSVEFGNASLDLNDNCFNFDMSLIRMSYFCRAFFLYLTMTWLPFVCAGDWMCIAFRCDICLL